MTNGITLIVLVISIIVMLILAGVSINAVIGDNGIIGKSQQATIMQSVAALQEYLQMEYSNYALEDNPYGTAYGLLKVKNPNWFYQNAQGYILDSEGHVLYLIKKSGLPEEIRNQIKGGDANKVSQYYKQQDVYGVTSDLQVYYCSDGTSSIIGLTPDDLQKDNPLEIAYDEDSLLAKVINGVGEDGRALKALSTQDLKSIKKLTIDTTEKLDLLKTFGDLVSLQTVYFNNITVPNVLGIQYASNITEIRFSNCEVHDYSAICGLTKLNKLYLIVPKGKNTDIVTLCSTDKGIASAEFSNLEYFGIVGNSEYLQSTSKSYNGTRYDVTDVTGLSNLSTITKQAVKYMYLQNLQLTSIASLADFVNVTILRCEENALTTFDGIQNMSKLTYLIAPSCRLNSEEIYTLGSNETDTQNSSTDALSYIYKDESENNDSLYYVDIRNSKNLKWTSYLSTCSGIETLYMDNNTSIKDIATIANVLDNCGTDYSIPGEFGKDVLTNNSVKLDLSNSTISINKFETLKNNTNLTHLSLTNTIITDEAGNALNLTSTPTLNEEINKVLSTCVNLKYLTLDGQTDLTTVDFIDNGKCTQLRELDLRETNVINLFNLNSYAEDLRTLRLSNTAIDLTTIQSTINRFWHRKFEIVKKPDGTEERVYLEDQISYWYDNFKAGSGLICTSFELYKQLENCTEITNLFWQYQTYNTINKDLYIDLSRCTKLENIYSWGYGYKRILPTSIKNITIYYGIPPIISAGANIEKFQLRNYGNYIGLNIKDWEQMFDSLKTCSAIDVLSVFAGSECTANFAELFKRCEGLSIKNLELEGPDGSWSASKINSLNGLRYIANDLISLSCRWNYKLTDISELAYLTSLESLNLSYTGVRDISSIQNLVNLKNLEIVKDSITDISPIQGLTNLVTVDFSENNISNISALRNLNKLQNVNLLKNNVNDIEPLINLRELEILNLTDNALYDNTYDSAGNPYYTLSIFADLNQKQIGKLKELYLSGNNIEDYSILEDSNLIWKIADWRETEDTDTEKGE